jgi:hypothetical protein
MDYRVYVIDDAGHISRVHQLECADDEGAKLEAAKLLDGHDLEVWHRKRRIAILKHHTAR